MRSIDDGILTNLFYSKRTRQIFQITEQALEEGGRGGAGGGGGSNPERAR